MFSSPFFPLVIAASAALAAPIARDLVPRMSECPYEAGMQHQVELTNRATNEVHSINLWYLGAGSFGCVYDILSTAPVTHGAQPLKLPAVAKVPRTDRDPEFDAEEISGLEGIHELYAYGDAFRTSDPYPATHEMAVMKKRSGKHILQTNAWKDRFPENYNTDNSHSGISSCEAFMNHVYQTIVDKIEMYAVKYGYEPNDVNWDNFLFSDDLKIVNIIDWGRAAPTSQEPADIKEINEFYLDSLQNFALLPLHDTTGRQVEVQGICQSDMRGPNGVFTNPMIRD